MRKIAFGYSTRCNIKCAHCVAAEETPDVTVTGTGSTVGKMDLGRSLEIIEEMAQAGVTGISFTAGEPFVYFEDLLAQLALCSHLNIYTRVVTNSFWAKSPEKAVEHLVRLKESGLSQLRLSYSRWHQQHVPKQNIFNAVHGSMATGIGYFVSFVTDFTEADNEYEQFLRDNQLIFFPEPVIYAGRADSFGRSSLYTDYQENRCQMNPYLAPDGTMYACCDAGSHFTETNFFRLGNVIDNSIDQLLSASETHPLYNCIRNMGITAIASFAGFKSREIITYRKCELCKKLFNFPKMLNMLEEATVSGSLYKWVR